MNEIDRKLISALRQNSRRSISDLANDLNVSRATISSHLDRLVSTGEIASFTIQTKSELTNHPVHAIMLIAIEGKSSDHVINRLRGMSEVLAIHTTNGRWDIIAEIGTSDLVSFDEILRQIRLFEGISQTETNILLATRSRIRNNVK